MSNELFTSDGKRKYLTAEERERYLSAAASLDRGEVRTFCMVLAEATSTSSGAGAKRGSLSHLKIKFEFSAYRSATCATDTPGARA